MAGSKWWECAGLPVANESYIYQTAELMVTKRSSIDWKWGSLVTNGQLFVTWLSPTRHVKIEQQTGLKETRPLLPSSLAVALK